MAINYGSGASSIYDAGAAARELSRMQIGNIERNSAMFQQTANSAGDAVAESIRRRNENQSRMQEAERQRQYDYRKQKDQQQFLGIQQQRSLDATDANLARKEYYDYVSPYNEIVAQNINGGRRFNKRDQQIIDESREYHIKIDAMTDLSEAKKWRLKILDFEKNLKGRFPTEQVQTHQDIMDAMGYPEIKGKTRTLDTKNGTVKYEPDNKLSDRDKAVAAFGKSYDKHENLDLALHQARAIDPEYPLPPNYGAEQGPTSKQKKEEAANKKALTSQLDHEMQRIQTERKAAQESPLPSSELFRKAAVNVNERNAILGLPLIPMPEGSSSDVDPGVLEAAKRTIQELRPKMLDAGVSWTGMSATNQLTESEQQSLKKANEVIDSHISQLRAKSAVPQQAAPVVPQIPASVPRETAPVESAPVAPSSVPVESVPRETPVAPEEKLNAMIASAESEYQAKNQGKPPLLSDTIKANLAAHEKIANTKNAAKGPAKFLADPRLINPEAIAQGPMDLQVFAMKQTPLGFALPGEKLITDETRKSYEDYLGAFAIASLGGSATTPPRTQTKVDYDSLPPGTEFIDPKGTLRRKPEDASRTKTLSKPMTIPADSEARPYRRAK